MWYPISIILCVGYLLGNLNGAVCISTLKANEDVRSHGSGNAGLTNFVRNYGTKSALLVIVIDAIKTVLSCLVGGLLLAPYGLAAEGKMLGGIAVTLGHNFPATLGFHGGKGIMCGALIAACIDWRIFAIVMGVFILCVLVTRFVSLGSVLAAAGFGLCFPLFYPHSAVVAIGGAFLGALAIFMHRKNIARLIAGTESKLKLKRRSA